MESSATQPLSGVRVIDFTQVMLGPSATQVLADYGADVIKIERPGTGDLSRSSIPDDPDGLDNPVFRSLNRNKRSIALDRLRLGARGRCRREQFSRRRDGAHGLWL
jgi:crotonobetainyl-CoA:carnitine CoA-transferase CaiB-like acyl-CoA transferase